MLAVMAESGAEQVSWVAEMPVPAGNQSFRLRHNVYVAEENTSSMPISGISSIL